MGSLFPYVLSVWIRTSAERVDVQKQELSYLPGIRLTVHKTFTHIQLLFLFFEREISIKDLFGRKVYFNIETIQR